MKNSGLNKSLETILKEFVPKSKQTASREQFAQDFKKAVKGDYESFVNALKQWAGDPKVAGFLRSGLKDGMKEDDKFEYEIVDIPCVQLIPTQNEIDTTASLAYPLKSPETVDKCLSGGSVTIKGPIVTFNGRYVIDGHHRWSQVYCINPEVKIKAINFKKNGLSAEGMLKAMQIAIAATTQNIAVKTVEGTNLLTISLQAVMQYVVKNMSDDVLEVYKKHGIETKEAAAKSIGANCDSMQKNNQPIPGAPSRGFMPQTDEPNGNIKNILQSLSKGSANAMAPFTAKQAVAVAENKNFQMKKQNNLNASLKAVLREDDSVEAADPVTMFQDFADISGSLADIYSTLTTYKGTYVSNPKVQEAINVLLNGVNQLMKQSTQTMQMIGGGLKEARDPKKEISTAFVTDFKDAYSFEQMGIVVGQAFIMACRKAGYNDTQIEEIFRSKYTRWFMGKYQPLIGQNAFDLAKKFLEENKADINKSLFNIW